MKVFVSVLTGVILVSLAVWFLPIGGIVQIIQSATEHPINALGIAVGGTRVLLSGLGIWAGIAIAGFIGLLLSDDTPKRFR